jgi:hypothetical protein
MIAQFLKFLSATDAKAHAAAVAELQTMAVPAPVKKRKGNPEALRKWREEQKAAKATGKPATRKAKAKPAAKAAKPALKAMEDGAVRFGGLECLPYDGGVVLRPAGRRRGIGFRSHAEFVAFVNACRSAEAHAAGAFVKARLGG